MTNARSLSSNLRPVLAVIIAPLVIGSAAMAQPSQDDRERAVSKAETIFVTAERREARAQDVPSTLEVLQGSALDELGVDNLEDYLTAVTGLGLTSLGSGKPKLAIRGVSNAAENQFGFLDSSDTVGIYLGEIPISGSGPTPDLNIYDLNRIEVLKGPQGTLYGEGAMGGAIRLMPNLPDLESFSVKGDATYASIEHGGSKYRARGAVNIPIIENRLAVRLTVSYVDDGGFIDNITTGETDVNSSELFSIRGQVLWQLTDWLDIKFLYLRDERELDNFNDVAPGAGDLSTIYTEPRFLDSKTDIFGFTANADLGFATLTSITSYNRNDYDVSDRLIAFSAGLNFAFGLNPPLSSEYFPIKSETKTISQEVRLVSNGDKFIDYVVGFFYRKRRTDVCQAFEVPGLDTTAGGFFATVFGISTAPQHNCQTPGLPFLFGVDAEEDFEQIAGYGEVKVGVLDSLDLIFGLRVFDEKIAATSIATHSAISAAFLGVAPPLDISSSESDILFKGGLSLQVTEDLLIFAIVSEGFRSGGANFGADVSGTNIPAAYGSDDIINYEFGVKSSWFENRLTVNASLFYIDWSNIQTVLTDIHPVLMAPVSFTDNVGDAEIFGFDLQVVAQVSEAISFGVSYSLTDTKLKSASPLSGLIVGEDLANSPEHTVSAFLEGRVTLWNGELYGRVDFRYVDDQVNQAIGVLTPRAIFQVDSYALVHLRAGWQTDNWGIEVFVENVADERNELGVTPFGNGLNTVVGNPRTIGVTISGSF